MMDIRTVQDRSGELLDELFAVWERSVRATHLFLSDAEIRDIAKVVPDALKNVPRLAVAFGADGKATGFIGVDGNRIEMLFVDSSERGKGMGKALLRFAFDGFGAEEVCVNEQNPQAVGFYEHAGLRSYKRTDTDEAGRPYPLLYMKKQ